MNFSFSATHRGDVQAPSPPRGTPEVPQLRPREGCEGLQRTQHVHPGVSLDAASWGAAHTLVHSAIVHLHVVDAQRPILRDLKP